MYKWIDMNHGTNMRCGEKSKCSYNNAKDLHRKQDTIKQFAVHGHNCNSLFFYCVFNESKSLWRYQGEDPALVVGR